MNFKTFSIRMEQIVHEFLFLNSYFNTKVNKHVFDYDVVFSRWKRDMFNRFREILIHMHWATSSQEIEHNQIIMDVLFQTIFNFEIRYQFGKKIPLDFKTFLEFAKLLEEEFRKFHNNFDSKNHRITSEYEKAFYEWKKNVHADLPGELTFDLLWENTSKLLIENAALFNIIYGDSYLVQIKMSFGESNASETIGSTQEEQE